MATNDYKYDTMITSQLHDMCEYLAPSITVIK